MLRRTIFLSLCCGLTTIAASIAHGSEFYNPYRVPVDSTNIINSVFIPEKGKSDNYKYKRLPASSIYQSKLDVTRKPDDPKPIRYEKISPILKEWLVSKNPNEQVDIILNLKDDMKMPLLPLLGRSENREDKRTARRQAIERIKKTRREGQTKLLRQLSKYGSFKPLEGFWIVNAVAIRLKLGVVKRLAEAREIIYMQPVAGNERPPGDANNNNDVSDGRQQIVSDPYFNIGLTNSWIGLMDTGIRDTHVLFNDPSHIAWLRDCVNGGESCNETGNANFDTTDFAWNHGTCSAAIITGNNALGNDRRGVSGVKLDSWQIYTAAGLSSSAAVRAIQQGVLAYDKVLVGEIQANESETGTIATAADNAYDSGAIIVSANGNFGPESDTVRSPGIAHKVLGVGGFWTDGGAQYNEQGRGPATDGRYKPDIQAPTYSETASNVSDNAEKVFGGTSGATPYAAAAAMLARNWLENVSHGSTTDNGQTYAFMILYGQDSYPYNNTTGAGPIEMATNGWAYWGKLSVTNQLNIDIPLQVTNGKEDLDVALWWPESAAQSHNDIDVHLIDPSGVEQARGYSGVSVFERTGIEGNVAPGTWTIRIRGYNVQAGPQTVYWAAHIRN